MKVIYSFLIEKNKILIFLLEIYLSILYYKIFLDFMENILKKLTLASGNLSKIPFFFCDKEASEERIFFKRKIKEGRRYGCGIEEWRMIWMY